jgi:hypothetical protein
MENDSVAEQVRKYYGFKNITEEIALWFAQRNWPPIHHHMVFLKSCIYWAVVDERQDVVDLLIEEGCFEVCDDVARCAAQHGNIRVLELHREYISKDINVDYIISAAVRAKNKTSVMWLIDNGWRDNEWFCITAVQEKNLEMLKYLVDKGTKCDVGVVFWALLEQPYTDEDTNRFYDMIRYLIEIKAPFSKTDRISVNRGRERIPLVDWARENGIDLDLP